MTFALITHPVLRPIITHLYKLKIKFMTKAVIKKNKALGVFLAATVYHFNGYYVLTYK